MPNLHKLHRQIKELSAFFFRDTMPLDTWRLYPGALSSDAALPDFDDSDWQTIAPPVLWGGYDQTAWLRCRVTVPKRFAGAAVKLHLDLVDQHGEALLYVDGQPFAGIDRNHPEALLAASAKPGTQWHLAIEAYAGRMPGPRQFRSATLGIPDDGVRALYFSLKNAVEALQFLPETHRDYAEFAAAVQQAVARVYWREPGSAAFRETAARAARRLDRALAHFRSDLPARLVPVGHAHIDVAWLWTLDEVQRKCGRTFATVLHLMQRYPEYHFVQSQPQLYQYTRERYPKLYEQIKARVQEGRWEPVGGMWVESDCNIPSGESLVRQVLHGKAFFKREFGVEVDNLWLPDVFGYSAALPQILRKAGIKYFFTAKLAWNEVNKFPHSSFHWQGIDGSRVLAHLTFLSNLYNSQLTVADLHEAWESFRQKGASSAMLLSYGFGDGGGGPTESHLENARRLENRVGLPRLERKSVSDFFRMLERDADNLPVWWGELYFEYHRGTLTTHAAIKRGNRQCEFPLREAEMWQTLARLRGADLQAVDLAPAWEKLLLNQFHDILPGSSIPEVYEQARRDYAEIADVAGQAASAAQATMAGAGSGQAFAIFNSLSWRRYEPVEVQVENLPENFDCTDGLGLPVPYQILQRQGSACRLLVQPQVPSTGFAVVRFAPGKAPAPRSFLKASRREMENRWFRLSLNRDGQITSLWDKVRQRQVLADKQPGNVLETFEDMPGNWEAWDIDADFAAKPLKLFRCTKVELAERGPLRAAVRFVHESERSRIEQRIVIYNDVPRIDFVTRIDWHEKRVLLKVAFPVAVLSPSATYEIQYGSIERPTHTNTSWDVAKFEVLGHKWADLSEGNYGVSLLNDCKYGYDIRGNRMRLTLLRGPYPPHPQWAGPDVQFDAAIDQGEHELVYALYPHPGDWRQAMTVRQGYELNVPLRVLPAAETEGTPARFVEIDHENLVLSVLKAAEDGDGVILRLYDSAGQRGTCHLRFDPAPESIVQCNLLEEDGEALSQKDGLWELAYGPFEIVTLRLRF